MTGVALALAAATALADDAVLAARFADACRARAEEAAAASRMAVRGDDGWLYLAAELRHLAGLPGESGGDGPVAAIADCAEQLRRAGVELLLVPVPCKAAAHPGPLLLESAAEHPRLDAADRARLDELERAGVAVLDLMPVLAGTAWSGEEPAWCRTDTHWSGAGCRRAAAAIAARVRERPWGRGWGPGRYASERREVEITGDLSRDFADLPPERLALEFVGTRRSGALKPVAPDPASPVLVLGDSHALVFHAGGDLHAAGAGLPDHLALELGRPVDVMGVRGSGATAARVTLMRRVRAQPKYLKRKRLVVWVFAAREFTRSSWKKVSLAPPRSGL